MKSIIKFTFFLASLFSLSSSNNLFAAPRDLDRSFGSGGNVTTYFNGYEQANIVSLQPDCKILAGGEIEDQTTIEYDMALARYAGDPITAVRRTFSDFDGDGRTDIAVFRDGVWSLCNAAPQVLHLCNSG